MELYLSPKVVGKGPKGRTACGSSAYRSCDRIVDNAGNVHDYRNKGGYVTGGIELPEGASEDLRNRQTLWSRHEARDIRKDAELFREITLALSNEFDYAAAERVVRSLASKLTDKGMCVQWDIHDTTKNGQRNLHAHMMVTMRELQPDGTFGNKNRSWNKYNGGLNIADLLRPEAARLMNEELAKIGSSDRVEHESFAARGVDKIPTKHVGPIATAMERKGTKTYKGNQNRYIDFLNRIHAENLRQVETQLQSGKVEDLIAGARAQKDGAEVFKDWDALFAMLRDTRRCRAAMSSELKKLEKIFDAYEKRNVDYLQWAGYDPESEFQKLTVRTMVNELRIRIKETDFTETLLLDSKEIYKAHNKAVYASRKADYDLWRIERNKRGMDYCMRRLDSIDRYMVHLNRSITVLDALLETPEYEEYRKIMKDLQQQRTQLRADYVRKRDELKQAKKDLKVHQKEVKTAVHEEKKVRKEHDWENR